MASFTENGVSSENRFAPVVDAFPRDQNPTPSEILGHLATSDVNTGSTSVSQNVNASSLRNGPVLNNYQPDKNKSSGLDKFQNSSVDAPSGWLSDARDAQPLYMDGGSFAENPEGPFNSWKKCPGDLQQYRCYMENGTSGNQILGGMHNNEYTLMQPPDVSINGSINMPNFSEGRSNASWCHPTGWPNDPGLGPSGDRSCMEWPKSLQNQFPEVNSFFPGRSWRLRTSSDNDAIANKGSQPTNNRSETQQHQPQQQHHHRRKGRTASGSSNSPITDASPNSDDNRSINLPIGQNVNTSDFDIQNCLVESMARLSLIPDISAAVVQRPPVMSTANSSDSMAQFMLGAQASLANIMEKSPFFTNNSTPIYWSTGGSQDGVFNQKLNPYHHQRPSTSDQYTQHDTLAGTFRGYPGSTPATYNFDQQQQQAQQQFQNREDDCIWYYQDPNGRIQGGFSSEQMASWFAAGRYFTPQLLVRRKCDDTLSTLQSYIDIYSEVPFVSKVKVPPVRGGITPDLIAYYRTLQNPSSFSTDLIAQMEKDPNCQKLLTNTGIPVMDGFGKNGLNAGPPLQSNMMTQTAAKLLEIASPSLNLNNSIYSLLSELISKGRVDQLSSQEVKSSADSSWPSPQQCQILSQLQEAVQRQQSTNDNSQPTCTSNGTASTLNGDAAVIPSSDSERTNTSSVGGEPKLKSSRPPQQQSIGSKLSIATADGVVKGNQQQRFVEQQQGRSRATATGGQTQQTPTHAAVPKTPAVKNCWAERGVAAIIKAATAANGCPQPFTPKPQSTPIVTPQKSVIAPPQNGALEVANGKKKNKQSKQSPPVQSNGNTKKIDNSKKTTKLISAVSRTPEMESLIQWTEQALKGVTMSVQHVDIPTLVECLVMIDGPFEVEHLILDHVENTPRTQQFVRDFLDRRHTCWQQHKKQKEQEANQKKSQKSTDNVENSGYIGSTKTYQEANDSSPENAWRQIKSKGGNGRRGKKVTKNR